MAELLEFKNVTKVYSRGVLSKSSTTALNDVSLKLSEDEPTIMTVAGESGSGKTTLAMLLLGFITPTTGQILYRGQDISKLRGEERLTFRREVQAVFQDPFAVFNPFYTVDHLLSVPIAKFKLAKSKSEAHDKMVEALTAVGLRPEDVLGRFPHQLSGGQRQRINVARAGASATAAGGRRAGVDGGCLAAGEYPGDAAQPPAELWRLDHLYHARPDHGLPYRQVDRGALSRLGDGGRRC